MGNTVKLTPATRRFMPGEPRGLYPRLLKQFLASDETEMNVSASNLENAYLGLRSAADRMKLKDKVYIQRQDNEVHLIRVG